MTDASTQNSYTLTPFAPCDAPVSRYTHREGEPCQNMHNYLIPRVTALRCFKPERRHTSQGQWSRCIQLG